MAAEYRVSEGNYNVALCERGIQTFADHTRNTLDLVRLNSGGATTQSFTNHDRPPAWHGEARIKVTPLSRGAIAVEVNS